MKFILTFLIFLFSQILVFNSEVQDLNSLWKYDYMTQQIYDLIIHQAEKDRLRPELVAAVIQVESRGHRFAVSCAGAIGLMQVMPFHLPEDPNLLFEIDTNIEKGCMYLRLCKHRARGNIKEQLRMYWRGMNSKVYDYSYSNKVLKYYE